MTLFLTKDITSAKPTTLEQGVRELENMCEELGWDIPPMLVLFEGEPDAFRATQMIVIDNVHPADVLPDLVPESASAIMLAVEGWTYPPSVIEEITRRSSQTGADGRELIDSLYETVSPSQHPGRIEVRTTTALAKDGTTLMLTRNRGSEPDLVASTTGAQLSGRIFDSMRVAMRMEVCDE